MTDELDTLRPEVREAINDIDSRLPDDYWWTTVSTELRRLADECATLKAQSIHPRAQLLIMLGHANDRAERAEAELAALKARIAEAPAAVVQVAPGAVKASFHGYACFEYAAENLQSKLRGKRVRLVVEE